VLEKGDAKPYTHRSNAVAVIAFLMGFAELADPGPRQLLGALARLAGLRSSPGRRRCYCAAGRVIAGSAPCDAVVPGVRLRTDNGETTP
jgi:hypothetical protein